VILNKTDLVSEGQVNQIKALVNKLNPQAELIPSSHGNVPMKKLINTKKFDFERA
jgi:G3E family GTPase